MLPYGRHFACASPDYFRTHGEPKTPAELANHALIGFRNPVSKQFDSWRFRDPADGRPVRHLPRPIHSFDDGEAAGAMVRAGLGIGYGPAWMGLRGWEDGSVVKTLRDRRADEASLYAVRLEKRLTPKRVHTVQDFIVDLTRTWHESFNASSVATRVDKSRRPRKGCQSRTGRRGN